MRIIARLDIKGSKVIKGYQMEGLRTIGEPSTLAVKYYEAGADELLYVDTVASLYNRDGICEIVKAATEEVFIPITVVGGIRTLDDAKKLFESGADKVGLNTAALTNPGLITEIANIYGSQAVVLSIDAKKISERLWHAYTNGGRDDSGFEVDSWMSEGIERGAGEILLTSVDRDGTGRGMDLDLVEMVSAIAKVSLLVSGGVGNIAHVTDLVSLNQVDGICIGKAFHQNLVELGSLRKEFVRAGRNTRIAFA